MRRDDGYDKRPHKSKLQHQQKKLEWQQQSSIDIFLFHAQMETVDLQAVLHVLIRREEESDFLVIDSQMEQSNCNEITLSTPRLLML